MVFFFYKQKTAYEMRISDGSSDVCSSDLANTSFIRLGLAPSRGSGRNEMVADEDNIRRRFQRLHGLTERPLQPFDRSLQGAEFVASRQHLAIVLSEATCIRSQDEGLRT